MRRIVAMRNPPRSPSANHLDTDRILMVVEVPAQLLMKSDRGVYHARIYLLRLASPRSYRIDSDLSQFHHALVQKRFRYPHSRAFHSTTSRVHPKR